MNQRRCRELFGFLPPLPLSLSLSCPPFLSAGRDRPRRPRYALGIQLNRSIGGAALLTPFERSIVNHYPLSSRINELAVVIRRAVFSLPALPGPSQPLSLFLATS